MRRLPIALLLVCTPALAQPHESVRFLPGEARGNVPPTVAKAIAESAASGAEAQGRFTVVLPDDLPAIARAEEQRKLLGLPPQEDVGALAERSTYLVQTVVEPAGKGFRLLLRLRRNDTSAIVRCAEHTAKRPEELLAGIDLLVKEVLDETPRVGQLAVPGPVGTRVVVDGEEVGTVPGPFDLCPGPHTVQLARPRGKPLKKQVTIEAGKTARVEAR